MKPEAKLWLRKWALMTLRAIVWHVDEWLHAQETALREDLQQSPAARARARASVGTYEGRSTVQPVLVARADTPAMRRAPRRETFQEWEARRSGIAVVSNKEARRRRGMPVREFDLRFAQR